MGNAIFIGVLVFLLLLTIVGYKKGLIKTVFGLVSIALSLVLVVLLTPTVKTVIRETPVYSVVKENVQKFVDDNLDLEDSLAGIGIKEQKKLINSLPIPQNMRDVLIENNTESGYKALEVDNFVDYVIEGVTGNIIDAITFMLLFIVILAALKIAVGLLDVVSKLPVLNTLNKSGGAVAGFFEGIVIIWIGCIVLSACGATEWAQKAFEEINNNPLLSFIYNNNLLDIILKKYL